MDPATIKSMTRSECGKIVSTTELDDTDINNESAFILNKIAETFPIKKLRYITSELNIREYSVHANTIRIQKVLPWDTAEQDLMVLGGWAADKTTGNEYYNFPSLWLVEKMRQNRGLPRFRFQFNPVERKLLIDPYPEEAGIKYWYISVEKADWTIANMPSNFENLLIVGTAWRCFEIVLNRRSSLGGVQRPGGFVDYPALSMRPIAEAKKQEFFEELSLKSKLYFT